jgi:hypothetical protein
MLPCERHGEEADVRADVEDAAPVGELDAVPQVAVRLEDLAVQELRFLLVRRLDLEAVRQRHERHGSSFGLACVDPAGADFRTTVPAAQ